MRFVRIADNESHAGQRGDLFGRALCIAPGDQDAGIGVVAMQAPDGLADLIVGGRGDSARVEDHQIGFGGRSRRLETLGSEPRFDGSSVGLRCAAAEILDPEAVH